VNVRCDTAIEVILPNEALRQIIQSGPDARLFVNPTQWVCEDEGGRIGGKLIDGTFPDWQRIVPKIEATSEVDADALSGAIASVSVADDDRVRGIKIKGDGSELTLQAQGSAASAEAVMSYGGVAFEFGVSSRYAATALATFAGHVVRIGTDGNMSAWTCEAMPDLRVCVMGMRV
jgi:DNA polymerase-3 subunit beta